MGRRFIIRLSDIETFAGCSNRQACRIMKEIKAEYDVKKVAVHHLAMWFNIPVNDVLKEMEN